MFKFLKSKRAQGDPPSTVSSVSVPASSTQHGNTQREMIRVVLKETLRLHGIPFSWLACEPTSMTRLPHEEGLNIELIVMQWNEQLLHYAPALQQQLLLELDRFDPSVDHSKWGFSWRFSPACGCPVTRMPDPKFWLQVVRPHITEEPVPVLDRRHTRRPPKTPLTDPLPSDEPHESSDFSTTQIAPLR